MKGIKPTILPYWCNILGIKSMWRNANKMLVYFQNETRLCRTSSLQKQCSYKYIWNKAL